MKKWIHIKKQKVDILEWLNQQHTPCILFKDWISNIVVTDSLILQVWKKQTVFDCVAEIFRENISTDKEENAVRAFDKCNNNALYIHCGTGG